MFIIVSVCMYVCSMYVCMYVCISVEIVSVHYCKCMYVCMYVCKTHQDFKFMYVCMYVVQDWLNEIEITFTKGPKTMNWVDVMKVRNKIIVT